jgi:hypothetical protein
MKRIHASLAIAGLTLVLAAPTVAGLEPKRASDLVAVRVVDALPCPGSPSTFLVERRSNPDGTLSPWTGPPAGQILIVNLVRFWVGGRTPGSTFSFILYVGEDSVVIGEKIIGASGDASLEVTLPTGIAVKSGAALCANVGQADVYGYLAKDN